MYAMIKTVAGQRDYHCSIFKTTVRGEYHPHIRPSKDLTPGAHCFKVYRVDGPEPFPTCFRQQAHAEAWLKLCNAPR